MKSKKNALLLFCLGAMLILAFSVIAIPLTHATDVGRIVSWLLLIVLLLGGRQIWSVPNRFLILICLVGVATVPFIVVARVFGHIELVSFVFHLQFSTDGLTLQGFEREIRESLLAVVVVAFATFAIANIVKLKKLPYLIGIGALLTLNPMSLHLLQMLHRMQTPNYLHQRLAQPDLAVPALSPDIIVVYLEGLERTFADEEFYGDLFEPLKQYEQQGLSFTDIGQVEGTGWSLAGLVATQCGVPIVPNGARYFNRLTEQEDFLTGLNCLGDVTAAAGYRNKFVVGGDESFGGIDHFLRSHAIDEVTDRADIFALVDADEFAAADATEWVLDDQIVFDVALEVYAQSANDPSPTLLIVETFGPHGSSATLSRNCTDDGVSKLAPTIESAVSCTITNLNHFLGKFEKIRNGRPTLVALMSDHLNHDKTMGSELAIEQRKNTVILFPLDFAPMIEQADVDVARPGSMIDVYPTLLAYAGFASPNVKAGLGRSLFGDEPTLIEEKGFTVLNRNIFPNSALSQALWGDVGE